MQIYPAIDLKDGKCVRLKQGDFNEVTVFNDEPYLVAKDFESKKATFVHVVDLDGARHGSSYSNEVIKKIIDNVSIPVQVGGGIRTIEDIKQKFDMGVSRVILGTVAIKNPDLVKEAVDLFGDKIAVGIDAKDGFVAISGWEEVSEISAIDLALSMKEIGVKTIIYTDISKDGMMNGINVTYTKKLVDETGLDIIASGGVSNYDDLENAKNINVSGIIIGKAIYQGSIDLEKAVYLYE